MKPTLPSLEKSLKASPLIKEKCQDISYAQNLYAALCNTDWQTLELWSILKDEVWNCSWRAAGSIVADIRDCGEKYTAWYCSGISSDYSTYNLDPANLSLHSSDIKFVAEGVITDEIRTDLESLGWRVVYIERED